jgi:hypothetical protein
MLAAEARMRLLKRAEAIEATPEFAQYRDRAARRCAAAAQAAETRKIWRALGGIPASPGPGRARP